MKTNYLFFIVFVFISILSTNKVLAQDYEDVLLMKDGGITRGIILERIPGKSVKIQIGHKNIVVIPVDEIEKITREKFEGNENSNTFFPKGSGYAAQLDIGYDQGGSHEDLNRLHINLMNGYRFGPYFTAGAGLGLRYYTAPRDILVPVFASLKINFLKKRISPFLMLNAGYSFDSSNEDEKIRFQGVGYMVNPSAGFNVFIRGKSYLSLGIGYEFQQFNLVDASASYFSPLSARTGSEMTSSLCCYLAFGF